ncbi:hypothetical protein GCM10009741_09580 [Kribbella lupini]|uniref:Uncharacterized protein n=1 Tax=Kribbella lupini TaxID=291602 RepID=A0ABP4KZZ1_9ACTN
MAFLPGKRRVRSYAAVGSTPATGKLRRALVSYPRSAPARVPALGQPADLCDVINRPGGRSPY